MLKTEFQELALDMIASSDRPLAASEIIKQMGVPNTSGRRYLKGMLKGKILIKDRDGRYEIAMPKPEKPQSCTISPVHTLSIIANALEHLDPIRDLSVKGYCLPLYFPEQRLAVEPAPFITDDPLDRELDLQRTRFITRILNCQWVIFDPQCPYHCPGRVINTILNIVNSAIACEVV